MLKAATLRLPLLRWRIVIYTQETCLIESVRGEDKHVLPLAECAGVSSTLENFSTMRLSLFSHSRNISSRSVDGRFQKFAIFAFSRLKLPAHSRHLVASATLYEIDEVRRNYFIAANVSLYASNGRRRMRRMRWRYITAG